MSEVEYMEMGDFLAMLSQMDLDDAREALADLSDEDRAAVTREMEVAALTAEVAELRADFSSDFDDDNDAEQDLDDDDAEYLAELESLTEATSERLREVEGQLGRRLTPVEVEAVEAIVFEDFTDGEDVTDPAEIVGEIQALRDEAFPADDQTGRVARMTAMLSEYEDRAPQTIAPLPVDADEHTRQEWLTARANGAEVSDAA